MLNPFLRWPLSPRTNKTTSNISTWYRQIYRGYTGHTGIYTGHIGVYTGFTGMQVGVTSVYTVVIVVTGVIGMLLVSLVLLVPDLLWDDGVVVFQNETFDVMSPQLLLLHSLCLKTKNITKNKETETESV